MTRATIIGTACAGLILIGIASPTQAQSLYNYGYGYGYGYNYYPGYNYGSGYAHSYNPYWTGSYSYYPRYWDYDRYHYYPRRSTRIGINPRWYPGYGYVYW